mmetsp:Transcript_79856/g.193384  ORF Transcript_79856/g.193384 Transcript_79856/m.193384 type:complete len:308 (+) Transcript_79856:501-1424(+)
MSCSSVMVASSFCRSVTVACFSFSRRAASSSICTSLPRFDCATAKNSCCRTSAASASAALSTSVPPPSAAILASMRFSRASFRASFFCRSSYAMCSRSSDASEERSSSSLSASGARASGPSPTSLSSSSWLGLALPRPFHPPPALAATGETDLGSWAEGPTPCDSMIIFPIGEAYLPTRAACAACTLSRFCAAFFLPTPMKSARLASSSVNPASRSISMSRKPRWRKARDEESAASASARACSCDATRVRSPSTCVAKRSFSARVCSTRLSRSSAPSAERVPTLACASSEAMMFSACTTLSTSSSPC